MCPLRLLVVCEPGVDGVFRHAEGVVRGMIDLGADMGLVYSSRRGSQPLVRLVGEVANAGGPVLDLYVGNSPEPRDVGALEKLRDLVFSWRPDVIHAHSSKAGALCRLLPLLGVNVPVLYTPNAYYGVNRPMGVKTALFNLIETALSGFGHNIHVSPSEDKFAADVLLIPSSRRVIIPNGVNCERFRPADHKERRHLRATWGIPGDARVIGTVGRYSDQKDPFTLYGVMKRILSERPDVWFFHVGRGEHFDAISELIRTWPEYSRIVRVDYLDDTSTAYRVMDVFTLSSRYEGLPISGLEAIASGVPMALTRCPGNVDFDGVGLDAVAWAKVEDAGDLKAALGVALDRSELPNNHREVALRRYSAEVVDKRLHACYRGLTASTVI